MPKAAALVPFPMEETTPPVTKMYLVSATSSAKSTTLPEIQPTQKPRLSIYPTDEIRPARRIPEDDTPSKAKIKQRKSPNHRQPPPFLIFTPRQPDRC